MSSSGDTPQPDKDLEARRLELAAAQLEAAMQAKTEGHSILNYNLANKQYLDALSVGKLLGVETARIRPYGGETNININGSDALREMSTHDHPPPQTGGTSGQPNNQNSGGQQPTAGLGRLARNAGITLALLLGGASLPLIAEKFFSVPDKPTTPIDQPEDPTKKKDKVEIEVN